MLPFGIQARASIILLLFLSCNVFKRLQLNPEPKFKASQFLFISGCLVTTQKKQPIVLPSPLDSSVKCFLRRSPGGKGGFFCCTANLLGGKLCLSRAVRRRGLAASGRPQQAWAALFQPRADPIKIAHVLLRLWLHHTSAPLPGDKNTINMVGVSKAGLMRVFIVLTVN